MKNRNIPSVPSYYDFVNMYNADFDPSSVHVKNTLLYWYFMRYLYFKLLAVFEISTPEDWYKPYFNYELFMRGHVAVFDTPQFGVICQGGSRAGIGLYYQPTEYIVANQLLSNFQRLTIGTDCEIITLNDDWGGVFDLLSYYAEKMALIVESYDMNIVNSKLGYVFFAKDKALAESFKKLYDTLSNNPVAVVDKEMGGLEDIETWRTFTQDLKANFIGSDLLSNLQNIENAFNTKIGIPNIKYEKNERLTANEVTANNIETQSLALVWLEHINSGFDKANKMFGLDLSAKLRFEYDRREEETSENGTTAF